MGSYSALFFANQRSNPKELDSASPYLLSKHQIPIFWLALFNVADLTEIKYEDEEDAWPYLVKSTVDALKLFRCREQWLLTHFPSARPVWLEQFGGLVETASFEFVHLDTNDVGRMNASSPAWRRQLSSVLGIFDEPRQPAPSFFDRLLRRQNATGSWNTFNWLLGSIYNRPEALEPWPYCGHSGRKNLAPWENDL